MKVDELRKIIKKYNIDEKEKIIVELYKKIPKSIKEDYDIDGYINELNKTTKKEDSQESFEQLEKEIEYFLDCAWDNLYCKPNRIIPKNERSKWRFKVKKFYKKLSNVKVNSKYGKKATELLSEIYKTLSYGTNYLIFTNWNTFGAIQVSQSEFLENIVGRILYDGMSKENIRSCIDLLECQYDPQEYHENVLITILNSLNTNDSKYLAIELFEEKVEKWKEKYNKKRDYTNEEYLNYFVKCIVYLYFELYEVEKGIKYFKKQYIEQTLDVKEYMLLEIIEKYGFYKEWINEYEKNLGKISYKDSLKEKYNKLKAKY